MADQKILGAEFTRFLFDLANRTTTETSYNPTLFKQMLGDRGGVETAKNLINRSQPSDGYRRLWELGRLDLTVEAALWESPRFHSLFSEEEITRCRKRLIEYEYEVNHEGEK